MKITLRYFASVRVSLGLESETVDLPDTVKTIGDVRVFLAQRGGIWSEVFGDNQIVHAACNHKMAGLSVQISDGSEVAFFPPVTGG